MEKSNAERFAERFGNDGSQWEDADGVRLMHVIKEEAQLVLSSDDGAKRWVFPDGSAIITTDGGWDLGYSDSECTCMAEGGDHADGCDFSPEAIYRHDCHR